MIVDSVMFRNELDLLECRLVELQDVPDLVHVIVEADVTHGGNRPREYVFPDHKDRFAQWADRICYVQATDLPDDPDAWSREHAQREWTWAGLYVLDAQPDDIVLHGDLDEIPTDLAARYVRPEGIVKFWQTLYCFAIDWQHPDPWPGTVAARVSHIKRFADLRSARCWQMPASRELQDAGWHFSWLGTGEETRDKLNSFCHPEVRQILDNQFGSAETRLDDCYLEGWHTDGQKLIPVEVDDTYPRWMREGNAPESWYRPR